MSDLNVFYGPNAGYVIELYERYRQDPESVPPSTRTEAGAPHPPLPRQMAKPDPNFPPTTNAACLTLGTITMQCAFSNRSWGMPLSGVDITSLST